MSAPRKKPGFFLRVWSILRGGHLTPARAAASVALGLAVGATPLYGAHLTIVVIVGLWFRLHVPLAYLVANISIPPMIPVLAFVEIEIGSLLRTGALLPLERSEIAARGAWAFAKDLCLGTVVFAPALAAVGGSISFALTWLFTSSSDRQRYAHDDAALDKTLARYQGASLSTRSYVASKLELDPIFHDLLSLGPLGHLLDVGTGRGQGALFLLENGVVDRVDGLDWDEAKATVARRAAAGAPATFHVGDVREAPLPECDTALVVDVLHYLDEAAQRAVIERLALVARRRILVRDVDPELGFRSRFTMALERLTTGRHWNRGERLTVRPISALRADLERVGFAVVDVRPSWGALPFANVLVVAERASQTSAATGAT